MFVQSLVFTSNNIRTLTQLNALASMRRLDNLTISGDGNPVTKLSVWRPYVVFRLAHFSLKHINGSEVSSASSRLLLLVVVLVVVVALGAVVVIVIVVVVVVARDSFRNSLKTFLYIHWQLVLVVRLVVWRSG